MATARESKHRHLAAPSLRPATLLQMTRAIYLFVLAKLLLLLLAKSRLNLTSNVSYCGQPTDGDSSLMKASTGTLQHLRSATFLQKARAIYLFVLAKSHLNLTSNARYCWRRSRTHPSRHHTADARTCSSLECWFVNEGFFIFWIFAFGFVTAVTIAKFQSI